MKLLIVTQVVDKTHPVLGFFHRWIEEFSKHCEQLTVICLEEGEHDLPDNVEVLSLGKEANVPKHDQLLRFYKYIWSYRNSYDAVFVHMNQVYVILGWLLWKMLGKKIGLWYTHGAVSPSLRIATQLTNFVFTASPESFSISTKKKIVTGHGIDTSRFDLAEVERDLDLITVGRISPAKNIHTLIEVVAPLIKSRKIKLTVVGALLDDNYKNKLEAKVSELGVENQVIFHGPVTYSKLPALLNRSKIFVTTAQNGSLDKVMLEAMSCGLPVVSMAPGSKSLPLGSSQVSDETELAAAVIEVIESGNYMRDDYVKYVDGNHSLVALIPKILHKLS